MTDRCRICFKPLDLPDTQWHTPCMRSLFGNGEPPSLDLDPVRLEELASITVRRRETIPGVQKKLSVGFLRDGAARGRRLTIADITGGFILKPPSPDYPFLPENEALTMRCATLAGVTTAPSGLIAMRDGTPAYITRRFDRDNGRKIHCEDMAQLSGKLTEEKYRGSMEKISRVIGAYSDRPGVDKAEFFLRAIFSFVTGNSDMHLKNFSLITEGHVHLSPAYDLLCTAIVIPQDSEETALSINGKQRNLRRSDFEVLGVSCGLNKKLLQYQIQRVLDMAPTFAEVIVQSFLPEDLKGAYANIVQQRMARLAG